MLNDAVTGPRQYPTVLILLYNSNSVGAMFVLQENQGKQGNG